MVRIEPYVNEIQEYIDSKRRAVKEIERREKALERTLEDNLKMEN